MNKKEENKKNNSLPAGTLINIMPCVAVGVIIGIYTLLYDNSPKTYLTVLAFIAVSYFIITNIHEFGHYLCGVSYGYQLVSYSVGPFVWGFENGKVKFSFVLHKGYDGACAMIPPKEGRSIRENVIYFASGIILNILSGILFIILADFFRSNLLLFILGVLSILIGVLNLLPIVSGSIPSDGKIIWGLLNKDPLSEQWMELNTISIRYAAGTRPRDLTPFEKCTDITSIEINAAIIMLLTYFKALDSGDVENTRRLCFLIEENIDRVPVRSQPALYYEICFISCITGDGQKAREYYEKAGKTLQKDMNVNGLRVKAYYEFYINKNNAAASLNCQKALSVAKKFPIKGQAAMERDLICQLQNIL